LLRIFNFVGHQVQEIDQGG